MKKVFYFFAMAAVLSLGLNGCGKEDTAESLNVDTSKVATVKGIAHATLDQTSTSTDPQYAPVGTKVFLKVSYTALSDYATNGTYLMETTIAANGAFTFENVPVSNDGSTTVSIKGDQFTASVKITGKNQTQKFDASAVSTTLTVGSSGFVILTYGGVKFE